MYICTLKTCKKETKIIYKVGSEWCCEKCYLQYLKNNGIIIPNERERLIRNIRKDNKR